MSKVSRLLILIMCAVFVAQVALSQGNAKEKSRGLRFGVKLQSEYSDNRDSLEDEDDNFDLLLKPRVDWVIQQDTERIVLDIFYEPAYRYRSNPSDIQNDHMLFHDLGLNYVHKLRETCKIRLTERFNVTDDPSVQEGGSTLRRDASFVLNRAEVGGTYSFSRRSNIDLGVNHMVKRYDNSQRRRESDEDSLNGKLTAWHQTSESMGFFAEVGVGDFNYHEYESVDRGFTSVFGGVGARKIFSDSLSADARIGYTSLDYDAGELGSSESPYFGIFVDVLPVPTTRFTGGVTYVLRDSDIYPFSAQQYTQIHARGQWHRQDSKWTLALQGTYRMGDYDSDSLDSDGVAYLADQGFDTDGQDTAVIILGEVSYKITDDLKVMFQQQFEDEDSDVDVSFTRNTSRLIVAQQF